MSSKLLVVLVSAAFAASISLVNGLATPAQAEEAPALCDKGLDQSTDWIIPQSDEICQEGTGDFCASTCGEDHEGVQITEVCMTLGGVTSCECCCYYDEYMY
jgi:hypothetical protein